METEKGYSRQECSHLIAAIQPMKNRMTARMRSTGARMRDQMTEGDFTS